MTKWQPIETAPKDGTMILVYVPWANSRKVKFAHYRKYNHLSKDKSLMCNHGHFVDASHWMPMPEKPDDL